ncbi:DUF6317 family protein [Kitasatospora sp. RB6PN24]|uniref:DUF6317 family protein n=1 Tax=Kitasatospora humi TaxID=2893891 RepID=UPI001E515A88|nr:DUF6317 family protein [Kitasatospora humi]MCC9309010.1 DUF6317 family protein [Kitasatospora humi]
MSGQFELVLGDLQSMATTFHTEAQTYANLKTSVAPPIAASGDGGLDNAITSMMEAIAGLHAKLAGVIEANGDKLKTTHDSYQRNDVDVHGVFEDLM